MGPWSWPPKELAESAAMAQQLAAELNICFGDWLVEAVYGWLQEAREEAKVYRGPTATLATTSLGGPSHLL